MEAYDHIQEESFSPRSEKQQPLPATDSSTTTDSEPNNTQPQNDTSTQPQSPDLQTELSSVFNAARSSQWGSTLGSWFSTARKQGETFVQDLQKEATEAQQQATKGFSSLREQVAQRTRTLSLNAEPGPEGSVPGEEAVPIIRTVSGAEAGAAAEAEGLQDPQVPAATENLPADIVKEAGSLVASLRSTAASKLKDLQKAEDAADEALLNFGSNVRNFLRDAVTIAAPTESEGRETAEVLFETQDAGTGKKVFHFTRLEAQLHAIHTAASSFIDDPSSGEEWERWQNGFDLDSKTEYIAKDLERYEELRRATEKLVPEKVEYRSFWVRYYFLRKAVEEEEKKRREVLKGATTTPSADEEIAWDNDEEEEPSTTPVRNHRASASTTTLTQPATTSITEAAEANDSLLKPQSPRRSHEDDKSVADSDASYDLVSGATSRATGSPKEDKRDLAPGKEDSDDDWE
ncbi:hypothetical protein LTR37_008113 [Vermiconidia calcicola]|uniref:Uncharacterized protein n=1 Tax=Vermiconidia calcicola TaxID=1690605 RepID=A0ACC3NDJ3_9PEZI|nr:hypothetical protein LTR37_008113 [Vermiconidia calcicola]